MNSAGAYVFFLDVLVIPLLALGFAILWIRDYWRYRNLPPGPRGWPIFGSLFQLGDKPYHTFKKISEKYGSVFSIKLGNERVVVLNDYASVREALIVQGDDFVERPRIFVFDYGVKNRDITSGCKWREQRKFMIQNMKQFGFGKSFSEDIIMDSIQMVVEDIDASHGKPMEFKYLFFLPILNVIWKYSADHPLPKSSSKSKALGQMVNRNMQGLGNTLINFMPQLRFFPGGFGFWEHQNEHKKIWKFITEEVEAHRKSFESGQHKDFIDVYLQEIHNRIGTPDEGKAPFNVDHLTGTLYDLFIAGTDTTSNTLLFGFLLLAINLDVQRKVQAEMDSIVGRGRAPCFSDLSKLPYLEAMIQEIHRYISLAPLSVYHSTSKDTDFLGYRLPKGTTVIQNIYAVHQDTDCWKDPHEFQPERFLDENNRVLKPPYYMPFSVGPRICPGEPMARMQLHLFFGCLLHKYFFTLPPGGAIPSLEPIMGITLAPRPFSLCVNAR